MGISHEYSSPVFLSNHQFPMEKDHQCCCNNNNKIISFSRRRGRQRRRRRQPSLDNFLLNQDDDDDACSQTAPPPPPPSEELEDAVVSDSSTSPSKKGKLSLPAAAEVMVKGEDQEVKVGGVDDTDAEGSGNGGECKTPTPVEKKIPSGEQVLCPPPPPRKPKTLPLTNKRGFSSSRTRRVLLDLSDEIESMFPPSLLADFGNKIKKVRKETLVL